MASSKLEDLAEKSSQKNGTPAHYIVASQALKDDLIAFMSVKFDLMQKEINSLKDEVKKSRQRETDLQNQIASLQSKHKTDLNDKNDIYMVGSSILREVRPTDLLNGTVKAISGGKVQNIKEDIHNLKHQPKIIVTQVGGNDLDTHDGSVEDTISKYTLALTETKDKFPDSKLVISGLPPRHKSVEIRTKVKDYNDEMKKWCETNNMTFINNEELFEFRSGEVDTGSYIMTGETPAVHLTRKATVRMLENIQKAVPELKLSDRLHEQPKTYAEATRNPPIHQRNPVNHMGTTQRYNNQRREVRCWHCGVPGHTRDSCRFQEPIRCHSCHSFGHKKKYCTA